MWMWLWVVDERKKKRRTIYKSIEKGGWTGKLVIPTSHYLASFNLHRLLNC